MDVVQARLALLQRDVWVSTLRPCINPSAKSDQASRKITGSADVMIDGADFRCEAAGSFQLDTYAQRSPLPIGLAVRALAPRAFFPCERHLPGECPAP